MSSLDDTLLALADPSRRRIVDILRRGPRRASELADALGASRPTVSKHLGVLRRAGIVDEEGDDADGRARVYALERRPFRKLRGWLDAVETFWEGQLESFKEHVEKGRGG